MKKSVLLISILLVLSMLFAVSVTAMPSSYELWDGEYDQWWPTPTPSSGVSGSWDDDYPSYTTPTSSSGTGGSWDDDYPSYTTPTSSSGTGGSWDDDYPSYTTPTSSSGVSGSWDDDYYPYYPVYPTSTPVSHVGYISVSSYPSGATVYVDGYGYGTTPVTLTENTGTHTVKISKRGYNSVTKTVTVYGGKTTSVSASLSQQVSDGYISVSSSPSGADVYIDGSYKGTTPITSVAYIGSHTVRISKPGYSDVTKTVSVSADSTSYVSATLGKTGSYLNIGSSPAGAEVYIDGAYKGIAGSLNNPASIGPINAGNHGVTVKLNGYNTYTGSVFLSTNEIKSMSVTLTPSNPSQPSVPAGNAGLNLNTNPTGAMLLIDNVFKGYAPININDIKPGYHTVLIQYTGYKDYSESINFEAGKTVERTVILSAAPVPTTSPAPVLAVLAGLGACLVLLAPRRK